MLHAERIDSLLRSPSRISVSYILHVFNGSNNASGTSIVPPGKGNTECIAVLGYSKTRKGKFGWYVHVWIRFEFFEVFAIVV